MKKNHTHILCIAENHDALKGMVYLLKTKSYHVLAAHQFFKALGVIQTEKQIEMMVIDLSKAGAQPRPSDDFSDGRVPPVTGRLLAETLRARFGPVPILFIGDAEGPSLKSSVNQLENVAVMSFPIKPTQFLARVEAGLAGEYVRVP